MKFTDLDPSWIEKSGRIVGVTFVCPGCRANGPGDRIRIYFKNPSDGGPAVFSGPCWTRDGATFDKLTLHPSVNVLPHHWHGNIVDGAVTTDGACPRARC